MDGSIAEIITQFASYLTELFKYLREFLSNFTKKDEKKEDAAE